MTPKEKAKDLYDKFYMAIPSDEMGLCDEASRQCALIAVDEIIDNWKSEATIQYPYGKVINYWNVVKIEIEKL
jgi:hypothetical protein